MAKPSEKVKRYAKDFAEELRDFAGEISLSDREKVDVLSEIHNLKSMIYGYELLFEQLKGGGNA
jgi:hypothetical protein